MLQAEPHIEYIFMISITFEAIKPVMFVCAWIAKLYICTRLKPSKLFSLARSILDLPKLRLLMVNRVLSTQFTYLWIVLCFVCTVPQLHLCDWVCVWVCVRN